MASIYTHIEKNKRDTWLVMIGFVTVITFIGWFVGEYFFEGGGIPFLGFALIFSGISGFISYYNSDKIVLALSRAKLITKQENEYIHNLVENLCIGAGLPKPKIYIIHDSAMNAFATGRDPQHAVIVFTTGIIEKLDKLELEGVIAHELSHIGNYDIRLMAIVSVLVGTITLVVHFFSRGVFYGRGRRRESGGGLLLLVGLVALILSPIIATLIKLAVSRNREFLADSSGALLTRYPDGLASALEKIALDGEILEAANGATAHLYISNPLKGKAVGFLANLYNTHPPVEERIRRLVEM